MIDVFIGTLNDNIQHEVHIWGSDLLEKAFMLARKIESKIMATKKPDNHNCNMEVLPLAFHNLQG